MPPLEHLYGDENLVADVFANLPTSVSMRRHVCCKRQQQRIIPVRFRYR